MHAGTSPAEFDREHPTLKQVNRVVNTEMRHEFACGAALVRRIMERVVAKCGVVLGETPLCNLSINENMRFGHVVWHLRLGKSLPCALRRSSRLH